MVSLTPFTVHLLPVATNPAVMRIEEQTRHVDALWLKRFFAKVDKWFIWHACCFLFLVVCYSFL